MKLVIHSVLLILGFTSTYGQLVNGYTDKLSYRAGEVVTFYTKATTSGGSAQIGVQKISGVSAGMTLTFNLTTQTNMNTIDRWKNGYGYTSTGTWDSISTTLKSGVYKIPATDPTDTSDRYIPIIIKAPYKNLVDVVVVVPTNTDMAYCCAATGDKSLYYDYVNHTPKQYVGPGTTIVSFLRPITYTVSNDHTGFLKWAAGADGYDPFAGNVVSYIADSDMDDYSEIANAKVLIVIGHSEYWSRQARRNFDKFVDLGKNAIILSGNSFWWQVRYQDPGNNPQLVCYKYSSFPTTDDPVTDSLATDSLATIHWNDPRLEYSILGSIGASIGMFNVSGSRFGTDVSQYKGYKSIINNSPIFSNTQLTTKGNILHMDTGEYDGTPTSGFDVNGDPILDVSSLGFYRAELLAYDLIYDPSPPSNPQVAPLLLFQKTSTSGKVFNASSNLWCYPLANNFNQPDVKTITQNAVNLFLNDSAVFTTPAPTQFSIKPSSNSTITVSYQACSNGLVSIQPGGIHITNGFKVEHLMNGKYDGDRFVIDSSINPTLSTDAPFFMIGNNSTNCSVPVSSARMASNYFEQGADQIDTNQTTGIAVYPNPTRNFIKIRLDSEVAQVEIYNTIGTILETSQLKKGISEINMEKYSEGIYILKFVTPAGSYKTKVIKR